MTLEADIAGYLFFLLRKSCVWSLLTSRCEHAPASLPSISLKITFRRHFHLSESWIAISTLPRRYPPLLTPDSVRLFPLPASRVSHTFCPTVIPSVSFVPEVVKIKSVSLPSPCPRYFYPPHPRLLQVTPACIPPLSPIFLFLHAEPPHSSSETSRTFPNLFLAPVLSCRMDAGRCRPCRLTPALSLSPDSPLPFLVEVGLGTPAPFFSRRFFLLRRPPPPTPPQQRVIFWAAHDFLEKP